MKWHVLIRVYYQRGILFRRALLGPIEWLITTCSRDGRRAFFDPDSFSWVRTIEAGAPEVRKELDQLLLRREEIPNFQDVSEKQIYLTQGEQWKTYFLVLFGRPVKEHCARCPNTLRLLRNIPGMKTAMFSILAPGKHIPAHSGVYKGVLRYHLALIVPKPESLCRIRVASEIRSWTEGRSLIFDDRYLHEVWNDSDAHRAVLFVDFARPLPWPLSLINRVAIWGVSLSPFVTEIVKLSSARARARRNPKTGEGLKASR